jgi:hypothetical protein
VVYSMLFRTVSSVTLVKLYHSDTRMWKIWKKNFLKFLHIELTLGKLNKLHISILIIPYCVMYKLLVLRKFWCVRIYRWKHWIVNIVIRLYRLSQKSRYGQSYQYKKKVCILFFPEKQAVNFSRVKKECRLSGIARPCAYTVKKLCRFWTKTSI